MSGGAKTARPTRRQAAQHTATLRCGVTSSSLCTIEQTDIPEIPKVLDMPHLLRLLYVSRATDLFEPSSINELMEKSQANNSLADISGILCSGRGYFIQAMEGSEERVLSLYAKVLKDERHCEASLLSIELVAARAFAGWSMAQVDGNALSAELHTRLVSRTLVVRDASGSIKLLQEVLKSLRKAQPDIVLG